ncbi:MAG TPA: prephenate dehydrogenase/arogenate dehydrogenase family protein [Blastocatellia bacterium]|nr:prephenate dehydrogenase/arogenate dehydrogenase family protein [Blastocatellia bacterium]
MRFKRIAIVGVGLIGGSFALAARRAGLAERITGWDNRETLEAAARRGFIDDVEEPFGSGGVSDADLVYLAAPVGAIIEFIVNRAESLGPGAIVTDAGSTKREICRVARESLPPGVHFVGGHPMAGSHKRGIDYASADLFRDAPYAVSPLGNIETLDGGYANAVNTVIEVVKSLGGKPFVVSAEKHDRVVARVSHLPQMVSTMLALCVARSGEDEAVELAGSGFADMTRLAESEWSIWEDICRTNCDEIADALDEFAGAIESARAAMRDGDFQKARQSFHEANAFMRRLRVERGGTA